MSHRFTNAIKRHAAELDGTTQHPRFATVASYDPNTHRAKIRLDFPNDPFDAASPPVITGWLPIVSSMTGSAWGVVAPLAPGQQVVIIPESNDPSSWVVAGAVYSTANLPAQPQEAINGSAASVQVGEVALVSQAGAVIRLCANGSIFMQAATVNIQGNLNVSGELIAGYGGGDSVTLQHHTHKQSSDSHGDTEQPTDPPTAGT